MGLDGGEMSLVLVDLVEGARHSGSVGGVSALVSVSLLEGSRSSGTDSGTVSHPPAGLGGWIPFLELGGWGGVPCVGWLCKGGPW